MTAREIVRSYLVEHGYDGLCNEECGCGVKNFGPCGGLMSDCIPARRVKADAKQAGEYGVEVGAEIFVGTTDEK